LAGTLSSTGERAATAETLLFLVHLPTTESDTVDSGDLESRLLRLLDTDLSELVDGALGSFPNAAVFLFLPLSDPLEFPGGGVSDMDSSAADVDVFLTREGLPLVETDLSELVDAALGLTSFSDTALFLFLPLSVSLDVLGGDSASAAGIEVFFPRAGLPLVDTDLSELDDAASG
jgi:hypothetical protein